MNLRLVYFIIIVFCYSCSSGDVREKITYEFGWLDNRRIPQNILEFKEIENYVIGYQDPDKVSERYNYPDYFVIGVLDEANDQLRYTTTLIKISPFEHWDYVSGIIKKYESDTVYVDRIGLTDSVNVLLYRKTSDLITEDHIPEFMMWKWMQSDKYELNFREIQRMNEHLFK